MGAAGYACAFHAVAPDGNDDVFDVTFLNNRIKKCHGCSREFARKVDGSSLPSPHELVVQFVWLTDADAALDVPVIFF